MRPCVCVCVPRTPRGGLSDTSALEMSSGGGSGFNSLPVRIRSPDFEKPCFSATSFFNLFKVKSFFHRECTLNQTLWPNSAIQYNNKAVPECITAPPKVLQRPSSHSSIQTKRENKICCWRTLLDLVKRPICTIKTWS